MTETVFILIFQDHKILIAIIHEYIKSTYVIIASY